MSDVDFREEGWDVFISFATPDSSYAEDLKGLLEEQGLKVFMAHKSIRAGEIWDQVIPAALRNSRVVAVLLSENSGKADWQRDEIKIAIEKRRGGRLRIVPIYIEGKPAESQDWEFGLHGYQALDLGRLGAREVAEQLGERLAERVQVVDSSNTSADSIDHKTVGDLLHGALLRIDRTDQWEPLVEICQSEDNAFFLLHGPRRQNLDLFIARIWRFLGPACGAHHKGVIAPLKIEYTIPRSAVEWENHLRYGLAGESERSGTAEELLRSESRVQPVFLVLSRFPVARRLVEGDGGLDTTEIEALEGFLRDRLPPLIARASEGRHPVRVLLAVQYEGERDALVDSLDRQIYRSCESHGIRYRRLRPVRPLEWEDIEDYLNHFRKRPPERIYTELRAAFDQVRDDKALQFRDILDLLARVLG